MKILVLLLTLVALPASAAQVCIDIPAGAPLTRLSSLCDLLKAQFPTYTNEDCAFYFMVLGAKRYHAQQSRAIADAVRGASLNAESQAFNSDLPLPTPATP